LNQLEQVVLDHGLPPGDRLPAERKLAELMLVSRNTLRGLLRSLEAQDVVSIKRGSGTYLRISLTETIEFQRSPHQALAEGIEAAFLVLPPIIAKSLPAIGEQQLKELQVCNITLGQAMCARNTERVWAEITRFFRIIVRQTKNSLLVRTVEQIFSVDHSFVDHFFQIDRKIRDDIFAGHVNILQALRERKESDLPGVVGEYLLSLCRAFESRKDISLWDRIPQQVLRGEEIHGQ
jgi:GntR family transcriptional regulator, transcriptional repressor for pyruvate dehydrogenase complex